MRTWPRGGRGRSRSCTSPRPARCRTAPGPAGRGRRSGAEVVAVPAVRTHVGTGERRAHRGQRRARLQELPSPCHRFLPARCAASHDPGPSSRGRSWIQDSRPGLFIPGAASSRPRRRSLRTSATLIRYSPAGSFRAEGSVTSSAGAFDRHRRVLGTEGPVGTDHLPPEHPARGRRCGRSECSRLPALRPSRAVLRRSGVRSGPRERTSGSPAIRVVRTRAVSPAPRRSGRS